MSDSEDDPYLYDRSGPPNADVQRLEKLLRPVGRSDDVVVSVTRRALPRGVPWAAKGLAAAAVIAGFVVWGANRKADVVPTDASTHLGQAPADVPDPTGVPAVRASGAADAIAAGDWIESTDAARDVTIGDGLGRVTLAAGGRLQVQHVSDDATRLYLQRGKLEARVSADARPRFFQVETDAARCVDLGCHYTLEVAPDGAATVRVTTGQVAFETRTREVFVPAGAVCVARKGKGPGTPRFEDARADVAATFDAFDAAAGTSRAVLAEKALATVRDKRDTLPAWHLLQDPDPAIVEAAAAKLRVIAGACEIASTATPANIRAAWKEHLHATCW